ncbi:MAG TPA: response regulator, partial [Chloroflexota bacterium]|nr:response regulator [Chloroflexota bacterium]
RDSTSHVTSTEPMCALGVNAQMLEEARVLIVDDQEINLSLIQSMLEGAGYRHLETAQDSREVVRLYHQFQPDLILLDLHMPHLDGVQVLRHLREIIPTDSYVPILVLTGDGSLQAKQDALSAGAKDFLTKPLNVVEVLLRIRNLLETRSLYMQLQGQKALLEEKVRERTKELEESQQEILDRLALAAEYRDDTTGQHAQRVADLSGSLARALGLSAPDVELIQRAALLHDVGKIGIPDHLLLKRGRYTAEEREQMSGHTVIGAQIVSGSRAPLLQLAEVVARTHHMRWDRGGVAAASAETDGSGATSAVSAASAPSGDLKSNGAAFSQPFGGDVIPLAGRIVAVADVFDALTHARPYKEAWPLEDAIAEITRQRGHQFDPLVVDAFIQVVREQRLADRQPDASGS